MSESLNDKGVYIGCKWGIRVGVGYTGVSKGVSRLQLRFEWMSMFDVLSAEVRMRR